MNHHAANQSRVAETGEPGARDWNSSINIIARNPNARTGDDRSALQPTEFFAGFLIFVVLAAIGFAVMGAASQLASLENSNIEYSIQVTSPRIVILKSQHTLYLFDRSKIVRKYQIRVGPDSMNCRLDPVEGCTPVGMFQIVSKKRGSLHHRFLGIDYPDISAVRYGVRYGFISLGEARALERAHHERVCPSWLTALGGAVGIHGGGERSKSTAGCIALADAHVAELFEVMRIGDAVEILP